MYKYFKIDFLSQDGLFWNRSGKHWSSILRITGYIWPKDDPTWCFLPYFVLGEIVRRHFITCPAVEEAGNDSVCKIPLCYYCPFLCFHNRITNFLPYTWRQHSFLSAW